MTDLDSIFRPLRGIRYRIPDSRDLTDVIAPPYDIISEERQAALYARSEHNFVRIELAKQETGSRYEGAAATLAHWLAEGVLVREAEPAFYVLEQEFSVGDRSWKRRGVFGLVRLPERGERYVLSHEGTLPEAKADRLELMKACHAVTSPIMLMAEDSGGQLLRALAGVARQPDAEAEDDDAAVNRLWVVRDREAMAAIEGAIGRQPLYIADGHHRFETACTYRDWMRQSHPQAAPEAGFSYVLGLVNSARDDGLRVFPTHRLLAGLDEAGAESLRGCMEQYFEVEEAPLAERARLDLTWLESAETTRAVFGAYGGGHLFRLEARNEAALGGEHVVDRLDVSVLHRRLIDPALAGAACGADSDGRVSHDAEAAGPTRRRARLAYATDAQQAMRAVDRGDYDFAFFLRPTRVSEVIAAARAGERMPGKSTYFYPKIPAGLVLSDASEEPI